MTDVYKRLAKKLDDMPNGYPVTESGVELKILRKIYTPVEAEMALKINDIPETAERIANRLGKSTAEMKEILDYMDSKGQVSRLKLFGQDMYMILPFIIGIYEYQLNQMDKELADLFEEYAPTLLKMVGGFEPALARVIPVNAHIEGKHEVLRYEDLRGMIESSKSFSVRDCICRWEHEIQGKPCKHPMETCLTFSHEENAYDHTTIGRPISKVEALEILDESEKEGLVHNTYNIKSGQMFVCNCCPCCCGLMRGLKELKAPYLIARSNFVALIAEDTCSACGVCAEERCPMDAIVDEEDAYTVQQDMCIGCGVCTTTCPTESIILVRRPTSEQNIPANDILDWRKKRSENRKKKRGKILYN